MVSERKKFTSLQIRLKIRLSPWQTKVTKVTTATRKVQLELPTPILFRIKPPLPQWRLNWEPPLTHN